VQATQGATSTVDFETEKGGEKGERTLKDAGTARIRPVWESARAGAPKQEERKRETKKTKGKRLSEVKATGTTQGL